MLIKLYHGSSAVIEKPLNMAKPTMIMGGFCRAYLYSS